VLLNRLVGVRLSKHIWQRVCWCSNLWVGEGALAVPAFTISFSNM
jgi:hypothetical protein